MPEPALVLRGIRKAYPGVVAVDDAHLELYPGEIHALVGENGAGKSTLSAIAYGGTRAAAGTVRASGTVGLVHQHFELVGRLRVWENVLLGREPRRGWRIDEAAARSRVLAVAERNGLAIDPNAFVETLPIGVQQRVELLRELDREPAVLLLDEPTAALAPAEIASFFATVQGLAARGAAIMIVTHKLQEVIAYATRVSVMRHGRIVAQMETAATSVEDIALDVRAGEIVGIAGVEGNGQTTLADAIAGMIPYDGTISFANEGAQIGVIPQDRHREALVMPWSIVENVMLGRQHRPELRRGATLDRAHARADAQRIQERFDVRAATLDVPVRTLSGGNQQKIVVGRALIDDPNVVLAYNPTRGIDVGAAALVQSRLMQARNDGAAVLLISFELDEILALADRIAVMYRGRIVGQFERTNVDRGAIGRLMAGLS